MMARVPASAMNTPLRPDGREGSGFGGSARSRLLVIDRKTMPSRPIFVWRDGYIDIVTNFAPPRSDILGMVTGPLRTRHFEPARRRRGMQRPDIGGCYGKFRVKEEATMAERLSAEARKSAVKGLPGWTEVA